MRRTIAEYDYGDFEGLTTTEIRSRVPDWDIWRDGCPNGENTAAVGRRADAFLDAVSGIRLCRSPQFHTVTCCEYWPARFLGLAGQDGRIFTLDTAAVSVLKVVRGSRVIGLWNATRGVFPG